MVKNLELILAILLLSSFAEAQTKTVAAPANTPATVAAPTPATTTATQPETSPREIADDTTQKDLQHEVIRRVIVFPFYTNNDYRQQADLAWWKVREFLSDQQRFLVATKRFMEQNEVFQPRKTLHIADVSILSKAIDSDCLITTYLANNAMYMQAYSAQDGQLLWKNSLEFVPSRPISTQLESVSQKLIQDFMANIPYQGFQIIDPINQTPLAEEGETILAKVDVGAKSAAAQGQKVQWITIERQGTGPLFQGGALIKVIAEGEVLKNENQVLTVEVKRAKNLKLLDKKSLVLIPDENKRLYSLYALRSQEEIQPNLNLLSEPLEDARHKNESSKPMLVAMVSIVNIVAAVLLAF